MHWNVLIFINDAIIFYTCPSTFSPLPTYASHSRNISSNSKCNVRPSRSSHPLPVTFAFSFSFCGASLDLKTEFPFWVHLVLWGKENVFGEVLQKTGKSSHLEGRSFSLFFVRIVTNSHHAHEDLCHAKFKFSCH